MVQNLLDTTRIEGGNLPIHLQSVELCGFVQQIGNTWRGNTENRGIRFELDNRVPPGLSIAADPFRLEQVVGNLMSNAGKFTTAGGTIRLEACVDGGLVHLAVHDTGRGIPPEAVPRVFDKFFQVEHGDKRAAGGAGLGLYIVRQLVEAMHGVVGVESEVGVGSRFQVSFPTTSE
jgi:signal transduction histidine kinase